MSKTVRTSSISPPPGQQDQSARLAASAEVGQVEGTNLCSHCGNGLLEEFCHEPPFVRFRCTDCGCSMDKGYKVIGQVRSIDVGVHELPKNAIVMGFLEHDDGFKYPFGYVRGEGYFWCDRDSWAMWSSVEGLALAIGNRMLEQGA